MDPLLQDFRKDYSIFLKNKISRNRIINKKVGSVLRIKFGGFNSPLTFGHQGEGICLFTTACQSTPLNQGCALISAIPPFYFEN